MFINFLKFFKNKKWSRPEIILFLERCELYISAGLTLDQALSAVEQGSPPYRIKVIVSVRQAVEQGNSFSGALAHHLKFNATIINIVKHGEQSGNLAQALGSARLLIEKQDELIKKCFSALTYPIVIALCAGVLTIGLLRGIMPQIIPTLKSLNVKLPLLTKLVIFISEEIAQRGIWYVIILIITFFILKKIYSEFISIKSFLHYCILRIPLFGKLLLSYHLSVVVRSMGTLLESGIPLVNAYQSVFENLNFIPLYKILKEYYLHVKKGSSVAVVFKGSYIPEYIFPLISAGEKTGSLGTSLLRASTILDRDLEHSLKRITTLIEPLMMVVMGGIIGAIALSILLPIYDVSKALQK